MWAVARVDAGLSEAEFFRLTLRHFFALSDRLTLARRHAEHRAGVVAAVIYNMLSGKRSVGPEAFFSDAESTGEQTVPEMIALVEMLNAAWGGTDLRQKA